MKTKKKVLVILVCTMLVVNAMSVFAITGVLRVKTNIDAWYCPQLTISKPLIGNEKLNATAYISGTEKSCVSVLSSFVGKGIIETSNTLLFDYRTPLDKKHNWSDTYTVKIAYAYARGDCQGGKNVRLTAR